MKRVVCALFYLTLWAGQASALTVYYQPTPATEAFVDSYYPAGTAPEDNLAASHVWQGWMRLRDKTFVRDEKLLVGGPSQKDEYRSLLKFDLTGLPKVAETATLSLRAHARGDDSTPVDFAACLLTGPWLPSSPWQKQPKRGSCVGWYPAPAPESWAEIKLWDVVDWYNQWQSGALANHGIMLAPRTMKNQFDAFRSTRYNSTHEDDPDADGARPVLTLSFTPPAGMPSFKLPLPIGRWLLSNEIGGHECRGQDPWPDEFHQGNSYFSLDFLPVGIQEDGSAFTGEVPILAAAAGRVVENGFSVGNGYFVTINHSGSLSTTEGYTSKYLHLARPSTLAYGESVPQGKEIGVMGNSGGYSTGVHLHFGIYYNGSGAADEANLTYAVIDGLLMKSYQTECSYDAAGQPQEWIRYYRSTNECGALCGDFGGF